MNDDVWVKRIAAIGTAVKDILMAVAALVAAWQAMKYVDEYRTDNEANRVYRLQVAKAGDFDKAPLRK